MSKKQGKELSMRKIREILRLRLHQRLSVRETAQSCGTSPSTVSRYTKRCQRKGLGWEKIDPLSDSELAQALGEKASPSVQKQRPLPDFEAIHQELKKKGVTLQLLFEEYKQDHPEGYQLSQFYDHYRRWKRRLKPSMRQTYRVGEKMFVDYAGQTVAIRNPQSGKVQQAQIFVSVLGASNYTYAEATWSQNLADWIASHVRTFEFFGGVPEMIIPDNLKSGVTRACYYEPDLNPTYHELARHYGTAVLPARIRKPKDKAKVETAVQVVERWILAVLRHREFFSLNALNHEIKRLLKRLNEKPFQKLQGSRSEVFQSLEKPALQPLRAQRFEYAEWKKARVNIDYHIELKGHYYSVPYKWVKEEVVLRYTSETLEIFHKSLRIASHLRSDQVGKHSTITAHMPDNHREYLEWNPSRLIQWASTIGPATAQLVEGILDSKDHPEQGYRSCLGLLRLGKTYSPSRLEAACTRAIQFGSYRYRSVHSILKKGLQPLAPVSQQPSMEGTHENIRGASYYQ